MRIKEVLGMGVLCFALISTAVAQENIREFAGTPPPVAGRIVPPAIGVPTSALTEWLQTNEKRQCSSFSLRSEQGKKAIDDRLGYLFGILRSEDPRWTLELLWEEYLSYRDGDESDFDQLLPVTPASLEDPRGLEDFRAISPDGVSQV